MRPGQNKRSRGRNNNGNNPNNNRPRMPHRMQTFDSSGPNVKIRGNAYQVFERYVALAREAASSGDRITAENLYQHAEHYFRIMNANGQAVRNRPQSNGLDAEDGDGSDGEEQQVARSDQAAPAPREVAPHEGGGERRPETPAELAEAAAGNGESRGEGRGNGEHRSGRGRRPGRRSTNAAAATDRAGGDHPEAGATTWSTDTASAE